MQGFPCHKEDKSLSAVEGAEEALLKDGERKNPESEKKSFESLEEATPAFNDLKRSFLFLA